MKYRITVCVILNLFTSFRISAFSFEAITSEIFQLGEDIGVITAFGHFSSDEYTDVITIQPRQHASQNSKLFLLEGSENHPYFQLSLNCSFDTIITGVVPGDFNGDSQLDVLLSVPFEHTLHIQVLWGTNGTINCKPENLFHIDNQPLIVDFNGDMIPDIIGQIDDERYVWITSSDKKFTKRNLTHLSSQRLRKPHSSGLIDLDNNMVADMIITGENNIELWYHTGKSYIYNSSIAYPSRSKFKWQSAFVDLNLDGKMDHLLPVCYDKICTESAILVWNDNTSEWETLLDQFQSSNKKRWGFRINVGSEFEEAALPFTLRSGDIDMDGYPDFIIVLGVTNGPLENQAVILRNIPCNHCFTGRSLEVIWDIPGLKDIPNIQIATFFDLFEDGVLDILASTKNHGEWKTHALKNTDSSEACFLKVLVLSGLCSHNCSTQPYGMNQPGPIVRYNLTKHDGSPVVSSSLQLSQSAHFPLQLPYSIFGLGQTPNFIDVLTVSIPAQFNENIHKREWIQIIPNSQIVVIPNPPVEEMKWVKKLFVTPSRLVLLTCLSLIGTCVCIALLIGLLHWKERREDKKEKMQDAHRFHFDAM